MHAWSEAHSMSMLLSEQTASYTCILCLTVSGVEPDVTHQTSWLGSIGERDMPQQQAGESSAQTRA